MARTDWTDYAEADVYGTHADETPIDRLTEDEPQYSAADLDAMADHAVGALFA